MERVSLENDDLEGANNSYLLRDNGETALIDTGPRTREAELNDALGEHGVSLSDVDHVFLTHWHPDHSGLAATAQAAGGATIHVHSADAELVASDDGWEAYLRTQREKLEGWNVPPEKRRAFLEHRRRTTETKRPCAESVAPFETGDRFTVGGYTLEAIHTPGHSAGSACFELHTPARESSREVLVGDTLLSSYTPNVGGSDVRVERPLDRYLASLRTLAAGDYGAAYPGHREAIERPTRRVYDIIAHHEQRAGRIIEILHQNGPADVWTVCSELFGELERFHIIVGAGEAYAHLDHLERRGVVELTGDSFGLTDETLARLENDGNRWLHAE